MFEKEKMKERYFFVNFFNNRLTILSNTRQRLVVCNRQAPQRAERTGIVIVLAPEVQR